MIVLFSPYSILKMHYLETFCCFYFSSQMSHRYSVYGNLETCLVDNYFNNLRKNRPNKTDDAVKKEKNAGISL